MKQFKKILLPLLYTVVLTIVAGCSENGYAPAVNPATTNTLQTGVNTNNSYVPQANPNTQSIAQAVAAANGLNSNNGTGCGCGQLQPPVVVNPYLYNYRYVMVPNYYVWGLQAGNCVPRRIITVNTCANSGCSTCASGGCNSCANNSGCSACANGGCSACANSGCSSCANNNNCSTCHRQKRGCDQNKPYDSTHTFDGSSSDEEANSSTSNPNSTKLAISILNGDARALYERLAIATNDQSDGVTLRVGTNYKCYVEGDGSADSQYTCDLVIKYSDGSVGLHKNDVPGTAGTAEISNQAYTQGKNIQINAATADEATFRIGDDKGLASYIYSRLPGTSGTKTGANIKCYPVNNSHFECMMRFQVDTGTAETTN